MHQHPSRLPRQLLVTMASDPQMLVSSTHLLPGCFLLTAHMPSPLHSHESALLDVRSKVGHGFLMMCVAESLEGTEGRKRARSRSGSPEQEQQRRKKEKKEKKHKKHKRHHRDAEDRERDA